jgi:hypothetical protein
MPLVERLLLSPLLAQVESSRRGSYGFQANGASFELTDLLWLAVLLGSPIALALFWLGVQRLRHRFEKSSPESLFLELCRAHQLPWRQRLRLWRMARQQALASPVLLFVSPDILSPDEGKPSERQELLELHQLLFSEATQANS